MLQLVKVIWKKLILEADLFFTCRELEKIVVFDFVAAVKRVSYG